MRRAPVSEVLAPHRCAQKLRLTCSNRDKESGIETGRTLVMTPFMLTLSFGLRGCESYPIPTDCDWNDPTTTKETTTWVDEPMDS